MTQEKPIPYKDGITEPDKVKVKMSVEDCIYFKVQRDGVYKVEKQFRYTDGIIYIQDPNKEGRLVALMPDEWEYVN